MGYTHYARQMRPLRDPEWQQLVAAFRKLRSHLPEHSMSAGGCYADELLCVSVRHERDLSEVIQFNGSPEELSHEDMVLERNPKKRMNFLCKTARKPYDLLVCGLLIIAAVVAPDAFLITSDGDSEDWKPALDWVHEVLSAKYSPLIDADLDLPRGIKSGQVNLVYAKAQGWL